MKQEAPSAGDLSQRQCEAWPGARLNILYSLFQVPRTTLCDKNFFLPTLHVGELGFIKIKQQTKDYHTSSKD